MVDKINNTLPDISAHERWFAEYVAPFLEGAQAAEASVTALGFTLPASSDSENPPSDLRESAGNMDDFTYAADYVLLKRDHTLRVLENARDVVASLDLSDELKRASLLAALYHDVGRFVQYAVYRSFSDAVSVNHGHLGCKVLKRENPLRDEPEHIQQIVKGAVVMHNRFAIPTRVSKALRTVVSIVRDSDKLDIFPVLVSNFIHDGSKSDVVTLHVEHKEGAWSPALQQALERKELCRYGDMRYVNDFKLLLGSWAFDLVFPKTRSLVRERGLMEQLLKTWPQSPQLDKARRNVLQALYAS